MCSTLVPGVIFEKMQNATHVASHVSKACCFANSHRFRNVFWAPPRMHFGKRKTDEKRCNITKHYVHRVKSVVVACGLQFLFNFGALARVWGDFLFAGAVSKQCCQISMLPSLEPGDDYLKAVACKAVWGRRLQIGNWLSFESGAISYLQSLLQKNAVETKCSPR